MELCKHTDRQLYQAVLLLSCSQSLRQYKALIIRTNVSTNGRMHQIFYVRASTPSSFHSTTCSTKIFQKYTEDTDNVRLIGEDFGRQMHRGKKLPTNGITSYGTVWRKGTRKRSLDCGVSIVQSISVDKDFGRQMRRDKRRPFNGITSYGVTSYGSLEEGRQKARLGLWCEHCPKHIGHHTSNPPTPSPPSPKSAQQKYLPRPICLGVGAVSYTHLTLPTRR